MTAATPTARARPPHLAFIGAGRLAHALVPALAQAGCPVAAVASRTPAHAARLAAATGGTRACEHAQQAVEAADLVFLTVPDDALAATCAALRWREGQAVVHCSGATEVSVLAPARAAGAQAGGFHPLQIFSDGTAAAGRLRGSAVAIEATPPLHATLHDLAQRLGLRPFTLPAGARLRYHAAAGYAASFLLPLLQEAVAIWASFGVDEPTALQALLPLAHGTLDSAGARGLAGALSGPLSRGDLGVLGRQLDALARLGPDHAALFRQLAQRQLPLAAAAGRLDAGQLAQLAALLGAAPAMTGMADGPLDGPTDGPTDGPAV